MKKIAYFFIGIFLLWGSTGCDKWLDINTDPNTATNADPSVSSRLSAIQFYTEYAYGSVGSRAAMITGALTRSVSAGNAHNQLCAWGPIQASATTPYQNWFVGAAANLEDLITKAEAEEAWHYIGTAKLIKAFGFMMMVDWYGEMPYTDALGSNLNPVYDDGETIFNGCLADLEEAIGYFKMTQPVTATPLSAGDGWNDGDAGKWLKLAYGLKARWLNNLSKKSSLYNPDAILTALTNAAQSNGESTSVRHYNSASDTDRGILVADPLLTSMMYDCVGMNTYFFVTKWYGDLLTNTFTGGSGVLDPRADKLIPSAHFKINGSLELVRSQLVDMITSDIRLNAGPIRATFTGGKWTVSTTNPARMGDSVYVIPYSLGAMYTTLTNDDDTYRGSDGRILSTGTFYTRADAPTHLMGYPELCFIKAEVLFRKGDAAGALTAYRNGIRAHMELMNEKLVEYAVTDNTSKRPIAAADIDAFLASPAVAQNAGQLTMAKIMQQKFIACSYSQQNWNDMRRFNYSAGDIGSFGVVYPDFDRPYEFTATTQMIGTIKTDPRYWFRRIMQPTFETDYNSINLAASNAEALKNSIWSLPVWWDTTE